MNLRIRSLCLVSTLCFFGTVALSCVQNRDIKEIPKEGAPGWVTGGSEKYDTQEYVNAAGLGDTLPEAQEQARRMYWQAFPVLINQQPLPFRLQKPYSQQAFDRLKAVLGAPLMAESWQDPTGRYYALAVGNKKEMRKMILSHVDDLDVQIAQNEQYLNSDPTLSATENFSRYLKVAPLVYEREVFMNQIASVIDIPIKRRDAGDEKKSPPSVFATFQKLAAQMSIKLALSGDGSQGIQDALEDYLQLSKIQVVTTQGSPADFLVKGTIDSTTTQQTLRSEIKVDFVDDRQQKVIGKLRTVNRESSEELAKAQTSNTQTISEILIDEMDKRIVEYLQRG